jgi:hypothetical protein
MVDAPTVVLPPCMTGHFPAGFLSFSLMGLSYHQFTD